MTEFYIRKTRMASLGTW